MVSTLTKRKRSYYKYQDVASPEDALWLASFFPSMPGYATLPGRTIDLILLDVYDPDMMWRSGWKTCRTRGYAPFLPCRREESKTAALEGGRCSPRDKEGHMKKMLSQSLILICVLLPPMFAALSA